MIRFQMFINNIFFRSPRVVEQDETNIIDDNTLLVNYRRLLINMQAYSNRAFSAHIIVKNLFSFRELPIYDIENWVNKGGLHLLLVLTKSFKRVLEMMSPSV